MRLLKYTLLIACFFILRPSTVGAMQYIPNQGKKEESWKKCVAARRRAARLAMFRGTTMAGISAILFFLSKSYFHQDTFANRWKCVDKLASKVDEANALPYYERLENPPLAAYEMPSSRQYAIEGACTTLLLIGFGGGTVAFLKGGYDYYFADEKDEEGSLYTPARIQSINMTQRSSQKNSKKRYFSIYDRIIRARWAIAGVVAFIAVAYLAYKEYQKSSHEENIKRAMKQAKEDFSEQRKQWDHLHTIDKVEALRCEYRDYYAEQADKAWAELEYAQWRYYTDLKSFHSKAALEAKGRIKRKLDKEEREKKEKQRSKEIFGEDVWESALKEHQENTSKDELLPISRTKKEGGLWARIKKKTHLLLL